MPYTGRLGTADSMAGNIVPGCVTAAAAVPIVNLSASVDDALTLSGDTSVAVETAIMIPRKADRSLTVTLATSTNVSAWAVQFTVRKRSGDATALITKTLGSGITTITPSTGSWLVSLLSADLDLDPGIYFWDFWRIDSGSYTRLAYGRFLVQPQVRVA